jgi:acyl carrier protein
VAITELAAIEQEVKRYVLAEAVKRGRPLDDLGTDDDFVEGQLFDSLSLLDFVLHLEDLTGIKIPGEDVQPENLGSLGAISRYLRENFGLR